MGNSSIFQFKIEKRIETLSISLINNGIVNNYDLNNNLNKSAEVHLLLYFFS